MEVGNLLDRVIESIQETCHSLLIIFRDIGSYHGNLHILVVLFNALGSLLEELEFLEEVAIVVVWPKSCSHDILHLRPSSDGWFTSCLSALDNLFPTNEDIVLELKGCHGDLLLFLIVVQTEDFIDLQFPSKILFRIIDSSELGHGELEFAVAFLFIVLGSGMM